MIELADLRRLYSDDILLFAKHIAVSAIIIIIGIVLYKGVRKLIEKAGSDNPQIDKTLTLFLQKILRNCFIIICAIMILNVFGVKAASLLALLGAAGLAVGLALKDTLGNIAAGITNIFLGSYRIGEFIEFKSFSGTVKKINLFTTILETPDGIYISAPNSSIWGSPLINYTRNGKRRMELSIGISYSDPVETAFQVMQEIIAAEQRFLKEPPPQVVLHSVQESSVKIAIRAWASLDDYWKIYWDTNKIIKAKMEAAGLHVPLPQREVRISSEG